MVDTSLIVPQLHLSWAWQSFLNNSRLSSSFNNLIVSRIATKSSAPSLWRSSNRMPGSCSNCQSIWIPTPLSAGNFSLARSSRTSYSRHRPPAFPCEPSVLRLFWSDGYFLSLGYREIAMDVLPIRLLLDNTQIDAHLVLQPTAPDLCTSAAWKLTLQPCVW